MDIASLKESIKKAVDLEDDERILVIIRKILKLYNNRALADSASEEIIARAWKAEEAIRNGEHITIEELERDMADW